MQVQKQFEVDVVPISCFLINRMSSFVLHGKTPYHVLFPNKSLFLVESRIFGFTCFIWDVHSQINKLDPKSLKCIFFLGILLFKRV